MSIDYVYLGEMFSYMNCISKAIAKQVSQAKEALLAVMAKARNLHLPIDILHNLFNHLVPPLLLYGFGSLGL